MEIGREGQKGMEMVSITACRDEFSRAMVIAHMRHPTTRIAGVPAMTLHVSSED